MGAMTDGHSSAQRQMVALPDGDMAMWHWPNPGAPLLVFVHANGFCASAYRQMLDRLADRFEIMAPDLRGHGQTRLPADPDTHRNWWVYARDLEAFIDRLPRRPDLLAGHSMGAATCLLATSRMDTPPPLGLVEPVIMPDTLYLVARSPLHFMMKGRLPIARGARRRTNGWPDRAAARARYARHPVFSSWADGVLDDYLRDGLTETGDGEVKLSCDPMWEAANYEAQGHNLPGILKRARMPVRVLKAERGSTVINTRLLGRCGVESETMPGAGHLIPMETPAKVADWIAGVFGPENALDSVSSPNKGACVAVR